MAFFTVMHAALPYCLEKQPDGRWVILNREYKPVGFFTRRFQNYSDYPVALEIKELTPRVAARISCKGDPATDCIFLYNDSCVPTHSAENMKEYMDRLAVLASLKLDPNAATL